MTDHLLIFGNGLGRSIHNDFFELSNALRAAWTAHGILTERQRELITSCLPDDVIENGDGVPTSEAQLEDLQRVLGACDTIGVFQQRVDGNRPAWLTEEGIAFPNAIRKFIHSAACYFHDRDVLYFHNAQPALPQEFCDALKEFISNTGAHVATLNYDDLLYDCFTDTPIFREYRLRDGFFGGGIFDMDRGRQLIRPANGQGWFLHLHGSPLFVDEGGAPKKLGRVALHRYQGAESAHLVLTSVKFKNSIIAASTVLSEYWKELSDIINSVRRIYIIGYGGGDTHLNTEIRFADPDCEIFVVERHGQRSLEESTSRWSRIFRNNNVSVIQLDNILNFRNWE